MCRLAIGKLMMVQLAIHCTGNTVVPATMYGSGKMYWTGNTQWQWSTHGTTGKTLYQQHCSVPATLLYRQHCMGPATLYCTTGNGAYKWYNWQHIGPATLYWTGNTVLYHW